MLMFEQYQERPACSEESTQTHNIYTFRTITAEMETHELLLTIKQKLEGDI